MNGPAIPAAQGALYDGRVGHARSGKPALRFETGVFSLLIDLDRLPDIGRRLRWFSHNRFNLLSLRDRDHGPRDGSALRPWIDGLLAERGIDPTEISVQLLCFPRLLGYAFNPLSVYFCRDASDRLVAVLYDVRNTFGDKHGYLIQIDPGEASPHSHGASKVMHVSPFLGRAGDYAFRLAPPGERYALSIDFHSTDGERLIATHTARRRPLTDLEIIRALLRHPLMTVKVITAIHWHGLSLFARGARFRRRPPPPTVAVTDGASL